MKNSKLIQYLKTLSVSEMKEFGYFVSSSSKREAKMLMVFFNYLKKLHPEFPEKKINKVQILAKLFPKDSGDIKKVQNLIHKLNMLFEEFLISEELKEHEVKRSFLLLEALKKRKLDKFFFKEIEDLEGKWRKKKPIGIEQLYNEYCLKEMCFSHPNYSVVKKMPIGTEDLIHQLDKHYFAIKLYWTLCHYNTQKYVNKPVEKNNQSEHLVQEILKLSTQNDFQEVPQIRLLSQLLGAFIEKDFDNYDKLKSDYLAYFDLYNYKENNDIWNFLINICYENYKEGKLNALQELFELNRFAVEKEIVLEDGYFANEQFWAIVHIGCGVKELEWTEDFINKYGQFLEEKQQKDTLIISNALLAFHKNDFGEALKIIATVRFQNFLYGLYAKSIQLQCYYELDGYEDAFDNSVRSFYIFLNRKDVITDTTKSSFTDFISICKQLKKLKYKYNISKEISKIIEQIDENLNIAYKSWLYKKVEELKK